MISMIKRVFSVLLSIILIILLTGCSSNGYWYLSTLITDKLDINSESKCSIAIIDTGINSEYLSEHQGNIIHTYNVIDNSKNVNDEHGHGTEMASVILGDEKTRLEGINPQASLIIIKAIGETGATENSNIAKAIDYLLSLKNPPNIINLSLGSLKDNTSLKKSINCALEKGVIIVASVGDYDNKDILYPAAYDGVISVQAIDRNNQIGYMSNVSDLTTLSFPGVDIDVLDFDQNGRNIRECSSSSVATALASGYFSLFISNCEKEGIDITNYEFVDYLKDNIDDDKLLNYNKFIETNNFRRNYENK